MTEYARGMRVATWNLERGGQSRAARVAQKETLRDLGADVVVLTEPPASYASGPGVVMSPAARPGTRGAEYWVAIVGSEVQAVALQIPYERLAVAARVRIAGGSVIVYGAVLPWRSIRSQAPDLVRDGESYSDAFDRVLKEQKADLLKLQAAGELVVWAADFNQSLTGPNWGGSTRAREALVRCLDDLGFAAWNGLAQHAVEGLRAIDLICGDRDQMIVAQGRISPERDGIKMSDHAGYWVEI